MSLTVETMTGSSEPPPLNVRPDVRSIIIPIDPVATIDVPSTPLFVEYLPIVESLLGIRIGVDTQQKRTETLVVDNSMRGIESFAVRVANGGRFPHRRSINYMDNKSSQAEVIRIGGRDYSAVSVKGADYSKPHIRSDSAYDIGVSFWGLVTDDVAGRALMASNWLQKIGITSEVIWAVSKPDLLPLVIDYKTKLVSQDAFKKELLVKAHREGHKFDYEKLSDYLKGVDFVTVSRATTVPFRLSDMEVSLREPADEQLTYIMNYTFSYLNRGRSPEDQLSYVSVSDYDNPEYQDKIAFLLENAARNLGKQLGLLHKNGVIHGYLHSGNITADGNFVDVDSLYGAPLGDPAIRDDQIKDDINSALTSLYNIAYTFDNAPKTLNAFIAEYTKVKRPKATVERKIREIKDELLYQ